MKKQIALITILCLTQGVFSMQRQQYVAPPLYAAAERGDYDEVSNLLDLGADVNTTGPYKTPVLGIAAYHGHTEVVKLLLEKGANVDAADSEGTTPLMDAVSRGHWHTAKLLIEAGADVNAYNEHATSTPLVIAVRRGHTDIARLLLDAGANINAIVGYGETALMHAAGEGHAGAVELLLTYIPAAEQEYIRNTFTGLLVLKRLNDPELPRDIRNLLRDEIIAQLVHQQMDRVAQLISQRASDDLLARHYALTNNQQAVADLLDLNNPVSRERIRKQIENNIKRILFGEPQERSGVTRELTLEEAFGSWLREPESETRE